MPTYESPGVYVEEVPSAVRPIAGVGTSTAGFIGKAPDAVTMPFKPGSEIEKYSKPAANEPVRITGWEDFKNNFGDFQTGNKTLAHAVYGYFNNGGTACYVARVTSEDNYGAALDEFKTIDEIAIVAIPGATAQNDMNNIITHCETMKDRFAILDGVQTPEALDKDSISAGASTSAGGYGAIYYPWISVYDPVDKQNIPVPPSGHIAGIYSRSDATRGVHKAPANEVIRGALGVERRLGRADQNALNPHGINVIRQFNGNVTVWGARTWTENAEWKYISTRRLMNYLRESIEDGMRWVVFEPNSLGLWQKIRRNVSAFLANSWRDGALFGATAEEAFYVKCDEETNPKAVRDLGMVVTEIGVAVINPAEFVIFRISQIAGE